MQTKLMRIEEDFFPSAGDAKPLGPPIPRGVPVQTIYSKRLGEAGFKTGADGKQSYTPGKAVVDAANGYVAQAETCVDITCTLDEFISANPNPAIAHLKLGDFGNAYARLAMAYAAGREFAQDAGGQFVKFQVWTPAGWVSGTPASKEVL